MIEKDWYEIAKSHPKPLWINAPSWANALAFKTYTSVWSVGREYDGWCWMAGDGESPGFILAEKKP